MYLTDSVSTASLCQFGEEQLYMNIQQDHSTLTQGLSLAPSLQLILCPSEENE